jgi:tetratricopeptide (TPR) repeat protein
VRSYLAGITSARTGDEHGRVQALADLASSVDPTGHVALREGFASSIRAEHERSHGHNALALANLEHAARATPFVAAWTSGFVSQPYERYVRAEILHALGRDDEALRWYGTFGENSPYDLVYLAPALYRQAQIHDRRGERSRALARYRRFLDLWKNCDAELRPLTTDAMARVAQLRSPPT